MKIGLFFGTFNPIHTGHLVIANYMANYTDLNKVWLVVTPHNPLKQKETLLKDHHRLKLAQLATEDNLKLKVSDIEFKLTQPSFTINTLLHLKEKYPTKEFVLIMGEDNLKTLHKWKNYEEIVNQFSIYVYPRIQSAISEKEILENKKYPKVKIFPDVPMMNISSTFIRKAIKEKKDITYLVPEKVRNYIIEMNFYR
ncbi:MAG: putative nicotinate-nucleotide adenylyltransferase [Bacteroidota bacterium]|nr:MAG: putative nicotinate-nucleotide adenylyltransferase [Bacteroidota bacterium]